MLLFTVIEVVLGFESHVARTFEFICQNLTSKESTAESALRRGQAGAFVAIKMEACTVVGRGEKSLLGGPGSEVRLGREKDKQHSSIIRVRR